MLGSVYILARDLLIISALVDKEKLLHCYFEGQWFHVTERRLPMQSYVRQ